MKILLVGVFDSAHAMSSELRARALRELGHEVTTVDYRLASPRSLRRIAPPLHRRRALSNVLKTLSAAPVDVVVVLKGECFDGRAIAAIRQAARAPVVNWFPDDPHQFQLSRRIAPAYDLFFTHDTYAVRQLLEAGVRQARYLPFGCHPAVHHPYSSAENTEAGGLEGSILFIGTYDPLRASVLSTVANLGLTVAGPGWRREHVPGATIVEEGVFGEAMFRAFTRARVCINIHQNFGGPIEAYGHGLNSRVFEVTGCGGLLLTDRKSDLHELYDEEREVVCYGSRDELRERVQYLLTDSSWGQAVARSGRERAISFHTLHHRFRRMLEAVGQLGAAA